MIATQDFLCHPFASIERPLEILLPVLFPILSKVIASSGTVRMASP